MVVSSPTGYQEVRMAFNAAPEPLLDVAVVHGPHTTIAFVRDLQTEIEGVGDSRRAPGDKADGAVGDSLAVARAVIDYGNKLLEAANERSALINPVPEPEPAPQREVYVFSDALLNPLAHLPSMALFADRPEPIRDPISRFLAAFKTPRPSNVGKITGD
jgi:hypothetical protein